MLAVARYLLEHRHKAIASAPANPGGRDSSVGPLSMGSQVDAVILEDWEVTQAGAALRQDKADRTGRPELGVAAISAGGCQYRRRNIPDPVLRGGELGGARDLPQGRESGGKVSCWTVHRRYQCHQWQRRW